MNKHLSAREPASEVIHLSFLKSPTCKSTAYLIDPWLCAYAEHAWMEDHGADIGGQQTIISMFLNYERRLQHLKGMTPDQLPETLIHWKQSPDVMALKNPLHLHSIAADVAEGLSKPEHLEIKARLFGLYEQWREHYHWSERPPLPSVTAQIIPFPVAMRPARLKRTATRH